MRKPTQQEQISLATIAEALRRSSSCPDEAPGLRYLDDLLSTARACREWAVDPDEDACAACLGEHPNEDGDPVCAVMEQKELDMFGRSGKGLAVYHVPTDGRRAPDWCPLRDGVSVLVRRA